MKQNVTIIGGGLGGLTAGALLAKDGYKVTLLEQHSIVGGCATTFARKGGFVCEVGLHEMDGVFDNPVIYETFEKLGVYDHITFLKVPQLFRITTSKRTIEIPEGMEEARSALIREFEEEEEGIREYFRMIESIAFELGMFRNLRWYHYPILPFLMNNTLRYMRRSVSDVMDTLFVNDELKLILNGNLQYYSDLPDTLSFLLHAVAQHSYYSGGGWFIKGGSGRLSDYLASVITDNGGEVITRAEVVKCEGKTVHYNRKSGSHTITGDIVISNLSPQDTYKLYDLPYRETREIADSLLTVYIGFNRNIKEVYGPGAYSSFIYEELDSLEGFEAMMQRDITRRGFAFVDYSQIDSDLAPEGKSFGVICMSDYLGDWDTLDEGSYRDRKKLLQEILVSKLERYYPGISDMIEYIETGTARSVQRYIRTPKATAYGFKPTPKQFFKSPKVVSDRIKGLYFVGQWVIAGGFSPAITSGFIAYESITGQ